MKIWGTVATKKELQFLSAKKGNYKSVICTEYTDSIIVGFLARGGWNVIILGIFQEPKSKFQKIFMPS